MKLRTWLQGAGVAVLVLFVFCRKILDMQDDIRMHAPGSATALALSLVANLILVSLVCMLLGIWLRGTSRWKWLRFLFPGLLFAFLAETIDLARGGFVSTRLWIIVLAAVILLSLLLLLWPSRRGEKLLLQLSEATLVGLGFFCIFVIVRLLFFAMWHPLPNYTAESVHTAQTRTDQPRTVWILFDELSYQQVFGDRYPNLQLPNFDELRKSSTLFTDTQPIVNFTEDAIPSIFLGEVVKRVSYTTSDKLLVGAASGPLHPFNAAQTPFALARKYGLSTGVIGWDNPYCGMLAPYLNQCFWTNEYLGPSVFPEKEYFWRDLLQPWILYGAIFGHPHKMLSRTNRGHAYENLLNAYPGQSSGNRILVYQQLTQHSVRILGQSGPDFVFLHLPIPHPSGLYNRKTQKIETSGNRSYIDNLALADKTLGQLLAILEQSPRWKNTNVIVCGDHSWRTYLWRGSEFWTPEDEAASHRGIFDPRPMLMVHLAGQTTPETVNGAFPLLKLHDILDSLAKGQQPAFASMNKQVETAAAKTP